MNRIILLCGLSLVVLWLVMEEHYQNSFISSFYNNSPSSSESSSTSSSTIIQHQDDASRSLSNQQQQQQQQQQPQDVRRPIQQISILGERNSGTRWTFGHVNDCFGHAVAVEKRLTRYKHWFQTPNLSDDNYPDSTLVLAQFRNPYDWLKAMERVPHHSPAHLRTKVNANVSAQTSENDWRIFLTKPWTTPRVGLDLDIIERNETETTKCQEDFAFRDIVSCHLEPLPHSYYNHTLRYSEHQPFYEMRNDQSGLPYSSILEMRTDKIRNFLTVKQYPGVADAWWIQYEYLLAKGTQHLLDRVQEWTGIVPNCTAKPPQMRKPKKSRIVEPEFAQHVREHLNWTVEQWIGYDVEWSREQAAVAWR